MKREQKKNIADLEKVMQEKKKLPKELKEKVNGKRFENLVCAVIVMIYIAALNMGMTNIPTENYVMDLKVFAVMLLIATIIIFEYGYKKDDGGIWLHGVEVMILGIFTLYLIYLYSIYYSTYSSILMTVALIYCAYYIVKTAITRKVIKKNYKKSLVDIGEIVKK